MKLRQALIEQSPSLALQRATQSEIARLDFQVSDLCALVDLLEAKVKALNEEVLSILRTRWEPTKT